MRIDWIMQRGTSFRICSFKLLLMFLFLNELSLCLPSCDITTCNRHTENLLSHKREEGTEALRKKISYFLKCVGECYHELFPNFIPKPEDGLNVSEKIFSSDPIFYLNDNWECVAQNSLPLLTCLAVTQSMKASIRNDKTSRLLACKKATAIRNCPQEILLEKCGETTADAMDEAFNIALKNEMANACQGVSSGALSNLHTYNRLENKFMNMAACIDVKKAITKNCLREFLTDSLAVKKYMCCEHSDFINCMTKDSDECIFSLPDSFFFRNMLSLGEDKCNNVEDCPQDAKYENDYNSDDRNNSGLYETPIQEKNLFSSELLATDSWKKDANIPDVKHIRTTHKNNNTQIPVVYTTSVLNDVNRNEENTEETNVGVTIPSKQSTKTERELNTSTYENARTTSISMANVPHRELDRNRGLPSPCAKIKVDITFVLLLLSIVIFS